MGRKQFTQLPAAPIHYEFYDPATTQTDKDKAFRASERFHDEPTSFLPPLKVGDPVTLQDPQTQLWEHKGVVTETTEEKLS